MSLCCSKEIITYPDGSGYCSQCALEQQCDTVSYCIPGTQYDRSTEFSFKDQSSLMTISSHKGGKPKDPIHDTFQKSDEIAVLDYILRDRTAPALLQVLVDNNNRHTLLDEIKDRMDKLQIIFNYERYIKLKQKCSKKHMFIISLTDIIQKKSETILKGDHNIKWVTYIKTTLSHATPSISKEDIKCADALAITIKSFILLS